MHYTIQDYMGEKHLNHGLATFLEKCKVGLIQLIPRLKQQYWTYRIGTLSSREVFRFPA